MSKKKWTEEEIEILKEYYPTGGAAAVKKHLSPGRWTKNKINKQAEKIIPRVWTDEEIEILKKYFPEGGAKLVNAYLPNPKCSLVRINAKAKELNIQFRIWSKDEIRTLKKYYLKGGSKAVKEHLPERSLISIRAKAREIYAQKKPPVKQSNVKQSHDKKSQAKKPHYRNDEYTRKTSKNAWTDREIEILCFLFPTGGSAAVQERLPERSLAGIAREAENLHIQKAWTVEEMEILRQYYPIEGKKVVDRLPDRTSKQCETMAKFKGYRFEDLFGASLSR